MAILSIIKSNLKTKKGNIISIVLLVFIISISLSTIISVNLGATERVKKACNVSKVADIVSFIKKDNLTDEIKNSLDQSKIVKKFEVLKSITSKKFNINKKRVESSLYLTNYQPQLHRYEFFNKDGLSFTKNNLVKPKKGEVFVPITFKNVYNCKIGDDFTVQTSSGTISFKISKFIEEPFVGASVMGLKIAFISDEDLNYLCQNADKKVIEYSIINTYLKDSEKKNTSAIKKELNVETGVVSSSVFTLLKTEANNYTLIFINILSGILWAFAILLFIVVLIIIGHNVSTSIEMDYVSFGILKAQGFTSRQIRIILLMQYVMAGMIGGIIGVLVSSFVVKYVNAIFIPVTGLLIQDSIKIIPSLGVMIGLLLLIAIYTFLKTKKVTRISPVQAISLGHEPVYFSSRVDFLVTNNLPISLEAKLIFKNILGNAKRYVSTIIIMAILAFFAITTTSLQQMSSDDNSGAVFGSISSDISIAYNNSKNEDIVNKMRDYIKAQTKIKIEVHIQSNYFTVDGDEYLGHVVENMKSVFKPLKGRLAKYKNEIVITDILAKEIHKTIGDTVNIRFGDKETKFMIVGLYQNTSDLGKNFSMTLSGMQQFVPGHSINYVDYVIKDHRKSKEIVHYLKETYKKYLKEIQITDVNDESTGNDNTILLAVNAITAITYVLTIVFVAIVSFMICNKMFRREQVDFGIYKSIGFTSMSLRGQFIIRYIIVVFIGSMIGMIANFICNDKLMSLLLTGMGISHFETKYTTFNLLIPVACISGFAIVFSYFVSGKIKRVSPKNLIQE